MTTPPPAWADLIEGLQIMSQHPTSPATPTHCEHDTLWVMADAGAFTAEEILRLDELGFWVDQDGGFKSYRFGSA